MSHYCITHAGLNPGLTAAYLIHAAGESAGGPIPPNTRAVALCARDEEHLRVLEDQLKASRVEHRAIWEDGHLFSIGIAPTADLASIQAVTSSLPLIR